MGCPLPVSRLLMLPRRKIRSPSADVCVSLTLVLVSLEHVRGLFVALDVPEAAALRPRPVTISPTSELSPHDHESSKDTTDLCASWLNYRANM